MQKACPLVLGFALLVGDPKVGKVCLRGKEVEISRLHSAAEEAKGLADLFRAKPLVGDKATKYRFLKLIRNYNASIVHIAANGDGKRSEIFIKPNPEWKESGSSLPNEQSYLLTEKDITDIQINARLVVISCSYTGRGKTLSEGVVRLARAFLVADARSVLATLWSLDD